MTQILKGKCSFVDGHLKRETSPYTKPFRLPPAKVSIPAYFVTFSTFFNFLTLSDEKLGKNHIYLEKFHMDIFLSIPSF